MKQWKDDYRHQNPDEYVREGYPEIKADGELPDKYNKKLMDDARCTLLIGSADECDGQCSSPGWKFHT